MLHKEQLFEFWPQWGELWVMPGFVIRCLTEEQPARPIHLRTGEAVQPGPDLPRYRGVFNSRHPCPVPGHSGSRRVPRPEKRIPQLLPRSVSSIRDLDSWTQTREATRSLGNAWTKDDAEPSHQPSGVRGPSRAEWNPGPSEKLELFKQSSKTALGASLRGGKNRSPGPNRRNHLFCRFHAGGFPRPAP